MSDNRTDLPSPNAPNFNQRLRETIQTYLGKQGSPLDRGLTLRDLLENGLVKIKSGFSLKPGSSGSIPLEPGNGLVDAYEPDLTPPPTPTGFAVTGAVSHVFVEHDAPLYTQGHGHLRTRLYGKIVNTGDPLPTFADAAEITQFTGTVHAHPSNPATTWRLWIKWETVDGVLSTDPAGGTNGLAVTTGQDVSRLLTALTGQITEGELYQTLQGRINLIDGPTSLTGSVNARVAGVQAQVNTINAELAQLTQTPAYDAAVTYAAGDMVTYNGGLYKALQTTTGNLPTNTTYWEKIGDYASLADAVSAHAVQLQDHEARIGNTESGLTAEASARQLLAAQVDTNTTGIQNEETARANADSALSRQITTLTASAGAAPGITRLHFWGFDTGLDGWANTYATASSGIVTWTPTVSNSTFIRSLGTSERYLGSKAPVIRARVRRVAGTGAWEGNLYHSTAAHGASTSYRKTIPAPSNPDVWNELEWDMSQLTAGGTDYIDNEITALRIDLVSDANTSVWEFDWVTVGTRNVTPQDVALQTEATVRASETGNLFAQYTVKVDVAGHVSGYGLASSSNGSTPLSQFGIRANQFFVAPPAVSQATAPTTGLYKGYVWVDTSETPNVTKYYTGSAWSTTPQALPFVIQASPTTINGVSVPAGVYINGAYIQGGTISGAQIAGGTIENSKLINVSANKITGAALTETAYIESYNWSATNNTGWRIDGNGNATLNNATVRGTVYATNGQFWGTLLGGAASAYSTGLGFYAGGGTTADGTDYRWRVGNPSGARIQWNGSAIEIYDGDDQLTLTSGGIDAAYAPGPNIAPNPDLLGNLSENTTAPGWTRVVSGSPLYALRYVTMDSSAPPWDKKQPVFYANCNSTDDYVIWRSDEISIAEGVDYCLSCWAKKYTGTPKVYLRLRCYDAAGTYLGVASVYNAYTGLTTTWTQHFKVLGPSGVAIPTGTRSAQIEWYGGYLQVGASMATRFVLNEGKVPNRAPLPPDLAGLHNPITAANISTYIDSAAIGTAYIADAAITAAKVGSAAITTAKIADAAITNAKIANAAVNTLEIAGNAATVSASASGTAEQISTTILLKADITLHVTLSASFDDFTGTALTNNLVYVKYVLIIDGNANEFQAIQDDTRSSTNYWNARTFMHHKVLVGGASNRTVTVSCYAETGGVKMQINKILSVIGAMR